MWALHGKWRVSHVMNQLTLASCCSAAGILARLLRTLQAALATLRLSAGEDKHGCGAWPVWQRAISLCLTLHTMAVLVTPYATTAVDIVTDLIIVVKMMPERLGWGMLCAFMVSDFISAGTMVWQLYQYQREEAKVHANGQPQPPEDCISMLFLSLFNVPGIKGRLLRTLVALAIVPLISLTMHVTAVVLAVLAIVRTISGKGMPRWSFWGLDPAKCAIFRSFVVGYIEAPCAIAFTTYAYLVPHKHLVKTFISWQLFFFNLAISMVHVLLEVWETKELLVKHGLSPRKVLGEISQLRADHQSVSSGAAPGKGGVEEGEGAGGYSSKQPLLLGKALPQVHRAPC